MDGTFRAGVKNEDEAAARPEPITAGSAAFEVDDVDLRDNRGFEPKNDCQKLINQDDQKLLCNLKFLE